MFTTYVTVIMHDNSRISNNRFYLEALFSILLFTTSLNYSKLAEDTPQSGLVSFYSPYSSARLSLAWSL